LADKGSEALRIVAADLHVHTCLSPCATLDMTPMKIVKEACKKGLTIIAITDHNSAENTGSVVAAARESGLCIIPGMEVTTSEEAHIVALFGEVENALSLQELVYQKLQGGENNEDFFGLQVVANASDEVETINKRLLIGATDLRLEEVVEEIHDRGGLAVAAHIDRQSFSVLSQLGFIPEGMAFDAVEISKSMALGDARTQFSEYNFPLITASDAHGLEEIGACRTRFQVAFPDIAELDLALKGISDRKIIEVVRDDPSIVNHQ